MGAINEIVTIEPIDHIPNSLQAAESVQQTKMPGVSNKQEESIV